MKKAISQMTQSLLLSLAARSQLQELREKLRSPAMDKGPVLKAKPPAAQKDILGVCCDPLVLAQQLTHIELVSVVNTLPVHGWGAFRCSSSHHPHRVRQGIPCWSDWGVGEACMAALTTASGQAYLFEQLVPRITAAPCSWQGLPGAELLSPALVP